MVAAFAANERPDGNPATGKYIELTNPTSGHTYTLYQVFTGTFAVIDGEDTLGNLAWGSDVKSTYTAANTADAVAATITNTAAGARAFANTIDAQLEGGTTKTAPGDAEQNGALKWTNLSEGYYIIKDTTSSADMPEGHTADLVVVQVLDNVSIAAKSGTVTFDKKVADHNDSTQAPTVYDEYGQVSDYDVGDHVPYEITITLPANFADYATYSMTVKDNMDSGLVFDNDVEVYVGDSTTALASTYYSVVTENIDESFNIVFSDVKSIPGAAANVTFTVKYHATLNGSNIKYGKPGNENEAWLTYSNNPTTGQEGGTTPHKTTLTFVYKFEVDKVDPDGYPLDGATFALYKYEMTSATEGSWVQKTLVEAQSGTEFTIDGIDAGWYKLVETASPAGYNSIDPIYFVVEHTYNADGTDITGLTATKTSDQGTKLTGNDAQLSATLEHVEATAEHEEIAAGLVSTNVVNEQGTQLPSTGGIGTTLFYVGGGILVLAAVILLVTKKRMSAND